MVSSPEVVVRSTLAHRSIVKDYFELRKNIRTYTRNQVEIVENVHEELDVTQITISVVPLKGDYAHAKFIFRVSSTTEHFFVPLNEICLS
ncbi:hypothetical protein AHF37_11531 [Paragonimus kellicotti]|nr:hypothetical protein AHF37_11531 [Paragonimus kellicotti]